jgi:choice-of-anchor C domain-containing protein
VGGAGVDYIGTLWQAGEGNRSVDLSAFAAGSLSQSVTGLTIGESYVLTFLMAGNPVGDVIKDLRVTVGGVTADFTFDITGRTFANMGWSGRSLTFTATSTSTTLTFLSLENNPFGPAIDNVALNVAGVPPDPAAVPEPTSLALLGAGVGGLAVRALRRRKAA